MLAGVLDDNARDLVGPHFVSTPVVKLRDARCLLISAEI